MYRRTFIAAVAGGLLGPLAAAAEEATRRLGLLTGGSAVPAALFDALRDAGWVEGRNLVIERRFAEGKAGAAPPLAAELVRTKPDAIVTFGAVAGVAARDATTTIPIIAVSGDPVRLGLVSSMAHPGGNVTGLSVIAPELAVKRLELLREMMPKATRVGEIVDRANQYWYRVRGDYEHAFRSLRLQPVFVEIDNAVEIPAAIARIAGSGADALVVRGDPMIESNRAEIAQLALKHKMPTVAEARPMPAAGMLMSYGPNVPATFRRLASIIDRVLKGAKPADIPIEQPTQFELVFNVKTAKALGFAIPQSLLLRADELIE